MEELLNKVLRVGFLSLGRARWCRTRLAACTTYVRMDVLAAQPRARSRH